VAPRHDNRSNTVFASSSGTPRAPAGSSARQRIKHLDDRALVRTRALDGELAVSASVGLT
jgi:hypothetical protein